METMLLDRVTVELPLPLPLSLPLPAAPPVEAPPWVPLLLAGDLDDDGSEPHICRGID